MLLVNGNVGSFHKMKGCYSGSACISHELLSPFLYLGFPTASINGVAFSPRFFYGSRDIKRVKTNV